MEEHNGRENYKLLFYMAYTVFLVIPGTILWAITEMVWETIKFLIEITYEITKLVTMVTGLILMSVFRVFVFGILMKG
jgi:hypothetical protein